ncbi:hypothetical protein N431DRAFT_500106 [Stipitochalara longipes BDJ]|nr:hypothetical protein N431DRAFT_500106 [Stipitochalara longipes BDJ]
MISSHSRLSTLRDRAKAEGVMAKQFDEAYQVCHDMASCELWDSSEEAQDYMAEAWTSSVLFSNDTTYKSFNPLIHDFTEALIKIESSGKGLPATDETIADLVFYRDLSEAAITIARVGGEEAKFRYAQHVEEIKKLKYRIKELESSLKQQAEEFEVLKSLIYD